MLMINRERRSYNWCIEKTPTVR